MCKKLFFCLLIFLPICAIGQSIEQAYPDTIHTSSDTLFIKFSSYPKLIPLHIAQRDTVDMGTDGAEGLTAKIYYGQDSLVIPYKNLPYWLVYYIPIQSPTKKTIFRLHFNGVSSKFPASYMKANKGKVQIEIPEVYELANILWTLSPSGQSATDLNKENDYYKKVRSYFQSHLNHPIFKQLDFPDSLYFKNYYDFRENSFTYNFKGNKLVYEGPYYYVLGNDWTNYNSLFRQLLPLIEDFIDKANYREFFKSNKAFYSAQIKRQAELMPIQKMWKWLESEFPRPKYQSYKVVFSPLIGGSHSTQNFATFNETEWFTEAVMFVCNTERYERRKELSEKQKEGLMSGVVFTEIDHNYVNPMSNKYHASIDSIFSNRTIWAGDHTNWYGNPLSVFNEYMTHAVFCLWVVDEYDGETAEFIIKERENLMVDKRHFPRFKEFNRALLQLRKENREIKVADLYPLIIDWCRTEEY